MATTAQLGPPRTSSEPKQPTDPRRGACAPASQRPALREMLAEIVPLTGFVPFYGFPFVYVLGPWLFLVLMLAGPLAFLFALVVVMIVAATVLTAITAALVAIFAAPYQLVGHLLRHRERRASIDTQAAPVVAIHSPRVAA